MSRRTRTRPAARATWATWAALAVALPALVTGCAGTPDTSATTGVSDASASASPSPSASPSLAPFPTGPSTSTTALPADLPQGCRDSLDRETLTYIWTFDAVARRNIEHILAHQVPSQPVQRLRGDRQVAAFLAQAGR